VNKPASQDNVVDTLTGQRAGGPRIVILFTADTRDSSPLHGTRTYFGVILRGKVAGREASRSSSTCSSVKMLRFMPLLPHMPLCPTDGQL
jgi:hypothetical protein